MLSLPVALTWIIATAFFNSALFFLSYKFWKQKKIARLTNKKFIIEKVIQTGPDKKALSTLYLTQLMNLSKDRPFHIDLINTRHLKECLQQSPLIKNAQVKKVYPNTLYVDYNIRRPIAFILDFKNRAVDEEGFIIPIKPFFSAKRLTGFYLGDSFLPTKYIGENQKFLLAKKIFSLLLFSDALRSVFIERIDVSKAFHPSLGRREIVVTMRYRASKHLLRLSSKNYPKELGNYINLIPKIAKETPCQIVIDMRLSNVAYIQEVSL